MAEKKLARSPLLYIHQPNSDVPEAKMQYDYITPKNDTDSETEINENQIENETQVEVDEEEMKATKRAKFKDMTIEEKIDYFIKMPSSLPNMKCEVKTEEKTYRGMIVDRQEDDIFMLVGRRRVKIALDKIDMIRLLGF